MESSFDDENSFGCGDGGVNTFIMWTLAAGAKGQQDGPKKVPGTPVKKVKTSRLIVDDRGKALSPLKLGSSSMRVGRK